MSTPTILYLITWQLNHYPNFVTVNWKLFEWQIFMLKKFCRCEADRQQKLTLKFPTHARTRVILQAQEFVAQNAQKSLLHPRLPWIYIYKVLTMFLPSPLSTITFTTILFAGWSLALADILTTILHDPKTTIQLKVASNWHHEWGLAVHLVKSRAFKTAVFVCTSHKLFSYRNKKIFCDF